MNRTLWLSLAVVFAFICVASPSWAQYVLTTPPSPQANGRAGIYTSSSTDDPLAALSNPALLGFQAERNRLMVGFYPERTRWNYYGPAQNGYSSRAVQFGLDQKTLQTYFHWNIPLSVGLGYQEAYWKNSYGSYSASYYERSQATNLAAALHYRCLQAGVGLNYRTADLHSGYRTGHPTSVDLGVYIQSPLDRLIYRDDPAAGGSTIRLRPFCTVAGSYVLANDGKSLSIPNYGGYGNSYTAFPLPRLAKMGLSVSGGLRAAHPTQHSWQVLSVDMGIEAVDDLVEYTPSGRYQSALGNIHPVSTLLFGKGDVGLVLRKGFEVGLGEAFFYRWGNTTGDHDQTSLLGTSEGYGVHLSGLMKALTWNMVWNYRVLDFVTQHLDLQYEQSTLQYESPYLSKNKATYQQLTLLWKY
jgi:hypothetical protein